MSFGLGKDPEEENDSDEDNQSHKEDQDKLKKVEVNKFQHYKDALNKE